jgi:hypothetical protein
VNRKSAEAIESKRVEVFALCKERIKRATLRESGQEKSVGQEQLALPTMAGPSRLRVNRRGWAAKVTTKDRIYGE